MILTCPACGTQYAVKDGAIPDGGRKVRCAACGHSWQQDPEGADQPQPLQTGAPAEPAPEPPTDIGGNEHPEGQEAAYDEIETTPPAAPLVEPPGSVPVPPPDATGLPAVGAPETDDDWDIANEIPDAEEIEAAETETGTDRRRNWLLGLLIAILLVVLLAAAFWVLAPDSLRQRIGFAAAQPTPLQIAPGTPERQTLASGNELVVVSGRVVNPSPKAQQVPAIEAQLRDKTGRLVYSWTIPPPTRSLPPGGAATFNSAEMDVPPSGTGSTVTLTLKG